MRKTIFIYKRIDGQETTFTDLTDYAELDNEKDPAAATAESSKEY